MDPHKPMTGIGVLILTAVALGTALLAGAGVWYWQFRTNSDLRSRLVAAEERAADLGEEVAALEAAASRVTTPSPPVDGDSSAEDTDTGLPPSAGSERQFAYIKDVDETAGSYEWVLDYAQFLVGEDAADAAAAAGDESPPPNDYYITNQNAKLRTVPVAAKTKVVVYYNGISDKRTLSLGEYYDIWLNKADGKHSVPFWVTIQGGEVIAAEEQYLP